MSVVSTNPFDLLPDNATTGDVSVSAVKKTQQKKTPGPRPERAQPTQAIRSGYPSRGGHRNPAARESTRAAEPVVERDARARPPHANARGRGAPRGRGRQFDRHSATGLVDSEKKEKQGWLGAPEDIPADEAKAAVEAQKDAADGARTPEEQEPEEVVKSLDDYLNERKSTVDTQRELRKANEGVDASQLKHSVALAKTEEDFFAPTIVRKSRKNRERKEKVFVNEIEQKFSDQPSRGAFRGGRGGARSDRRPNARQANINLGDKNAFPAL
ncbi:hypothetical protein GGH12_005276 [Coemansia sp. RSA 1822]|nr:hypothetical protein LPJ76_005312 [Coemansia sp. RSA 638]KAJ2123683.1 hypothetical protein IW147_002432 [Coemansia sp. RSA 720]KAJ2539563.1 hypothetical protein GGF49_005133 [Coemansia sp. RSA 1853]KAJ2559722.1 hypothetical protein GGH12_005276 [Coemansia sp. RSA 1822]KAJ2660523.1 hypothetical protein IW148_003775 [Coemansia sp. RSA 1199]